MSKNSPDLNTLLAMYNGYPIYNPEIQNDMVQNAANSITYAQNREKAGQALTQYALQIPIEQIEMHKPQTSQLREKQMMSLFRAYQNGNVAGNGWRKIDENNNTIDTIQYVLSNDPRFKYEGPIAVSQDDISAVARVSLTSKQLIAQSKKGEQIEGISRWDDSINMSQMLESANTLVAMANVIRQQSGRLNLSLNNMFPKEIADTVVRGVVADKVNGIENFEELSKKQRTGILSKATGLLSRALETLGLNKNKGNQGIEK